MAMARVVHQVVPNFILILIGYVHPNNSSFYSGVCDKGINTFKLNKSVLSRSVSQVSVIPITSKGICVEFVS